MGFKKDAAPVVEAPAAAPDGQATLPTSPFAVAPRKYTDDERRVHGQVKMHGIICGYKVAAALAPTLANTSASIKDELHKLAGEVAAKIEAYSFSEE